MGATQCFATFGCGSRVTGQAGGIVMRTGDLLNDSMTHCHDIRTGIDQLPVCSAFLSFVNRI